MAKKEETVIEAAVNPPETKEAIKSGTGTALVHWKDRMVAVKQQVQEAEKPQGGFISFKGGRMSYGDELLPGDKINAIIIDYRFENDLYLSKYVAGVNRSPDCYAICRPGELLAPNLVKNQETGEMEYGAENVQGGPDILTAAEEPQCDGCWANEWGSAKFIGDKDPTARGKACKTSRRIMILAADDCTSPEKIARAQVVTLIPPATSVDNFQGMMNQVTKALDTVMFGAVVEISVKPHPKFLFQVHFKVLQQINNDDILQALLARHEKETQKEVNYPKNSEREGAPPPPQSKKY